MLKKNIFYIIFLFAIYSCGSSKKANSANYIYFQTGTDTVLIPQKEIVIQNGDILSIRVFSSTSNQEQAAVFNIPNPEKENSLGYQVTQTGNIDMPVIGTVKAAGLTKTQLQDFLTKKITNYVRNPTVMIGFIDFKVNVLGEVHRPGVQKFSVDRVSIIDAISSAGDLTDYGQRQDVIVIREDNGKKIYQSIDLRDKALFQSPVFLLQPNDIVYVKPNAIKVKDISSDPAAQRKTGIILSVVGILVSIASVVIFAVKL
jgi:polysaccharide export outer membrane protein